MFGELKKRFKKKEDSKIKRIGPDVGKQWLLRSKWYLKRMFGYIGEDVEIRKGAYLVHTENIELGHRVVIRPGCQLYADEVAHICIAPDVLIGPGVSIFTNNHKIQEGPDDYEYKNVTLSDGCWIGANVILLAGTHVGHNAVVGAGSVVTGSHVPNGEIWAGNPARPIKKTDDAAKILKAQYTSKGKLVRRKQR